MDREQKAAAVAELTERLKESQAVFAIDYRGISVTQAADLRRRLSEAGATFKVVKNRLAKRAAADAGAEGLDEVLVGPTALTLVDGDAVVAAKAITSFAREHELLEFKGGLMEGAMLDRDGFLAISRLPGRDVLHGQLVGITASPLTGLVGALSGMMRGLAVALGQIAEQGLVGGDAPAAEEAAAPEAEGESEAAADDAEQAEGEGEAEAEDAESGESEPEAESEQAEAPESESEAAPEAVAEEEETSGADEAQTESEGEPESSEGTEPEGEATEESDSEETPEED